MKYLVRCVLASGFVFAAQAWAQTATIPIFQQAVTTGMVGLAGSETARLSVLNLAPATTLPAPCNVQLSFYDQKNNPLKQISVTALTPQTAASLDLSGAGVSTGTMPSLVRGVVRTSSSTTATNSSIFPSMPAVIIPGCAVMTTLVVFDSNSGVTHTFTADTRPMTTLPVPLAITQMQ